MTEKMVLEKGHKGDEGGTNIAPQRKIIPGIGNKNYKGPKERVPLM